MSKPRGFSSRCNTGLIVAQVYMAMYPGKVKVKNGKAVSVHAKKAHTGCSRGTLPLILNLEISWR